MATKPLQPTQRARESRGWNRDTQRRRQATVRGMRRVGRVFGPRDTAARVCRGFATGARSVWPCGFWTSLRPHASLTAPVLFLVCVQKGCGARRRLIELLCALVFLLLVLFSHCCCRLLLLRLLWRCSSDARTALLVRIGVIEVRCAVETLVDDVDNQADKRDRNREHPYVARGSGLCTAQNKQTVRHRLRRERRKKRSQSLTIFCAKKGCDK